MGGVVYEEGDRDHPIRVLCAATASMDTTVRLWRVSVSAVAPTTPEEFGTGACLRVFWGHHGPVRCLAIHGPKAHIYSGGVDGVVRVWDARKDDDAHALHRHWRAHPDTVMAIKLHGKGETCMLVTASSDGKCKAWSHTKPSEASSGGAGPETRVFPVSASDLIGTMSGSGMHELLLPYMDA